VARTVRATCPADHSTVTVDSSMVTLHLCVNLPSASFFAFPCDQCRTIHRPSAPADVQRTLIEGRVHVRRWHAPLEALDPKRHSLPPISKDELLDLSLATDEQLHAELSGR
jgi:hypothetical protein